MSFSLHKLALPPEEMVLLLHSLCQYKHLCSYVVNCFGEPRWVQTNLFFGQMRLLLLAAVLV